MAITNAALLKKFGPKPAKMTKEEKTLFKERLNNAFNLGEIAYNEGKQMAPFYNPAFTKLIETYGYATYEKCELMKLYIQGWTAQHINSAPFFFE